MERPILFSTPMVQAILDGRKTQTRRVVKAIGKAAGFKIAVMPDGTKLPFGIDEEEAMLDYIKCPYGKVGDILWVRETYTELVPEHFITSKYVYKADAIHGGCDTEEIRQDYIKQGYPYKWKPSIFMPKAACRIKLEITDIRAEKLQDISWKDAEEEGIAWIITNRPRFKNYYSIENPWYRNPVDSYKSLWEAINGVGSWDKYPWVWAITFKKL